MLFATDARGNVSTYGYDGLNRLTQVIDPLSGTTGFSYDPNGNLLNVTDARSNATTYTYENMDRLATRRDPLLRTENYQYDLAGNLTQFTDRKSQPTAYTYDALNRRTGVIINLFYNGSLVKTLCWLQRIYCRHALANRLIKLCG